MPPVVFVTGRSRLSAGFAIITPPSSTPISSTVAPPAASMTSPMVMPTGTRSVTGVLDRAGHSEVLMRHRLVEADVDERFNVRNGYVSTSLGKSAGRNHAARHQVDKDELIASRIDIRQRHNPDSRRRLALQRRNDVVILVLDSDDAFARADHLHGHPHAAQKGLGAVMEQLLVLVQQRLTLCSIGNEQRNPGPETSPPQGTRHHPRPRSPSSPRRSADEGRLRPWPSQLAMPSHVPSFGQNLRICQIAIDSDR